MPNINVTFYKKLEERCKNYFIVNKFELACSNSSLFSNKNHTFYLKTLHIFLKDDVKVEQKISFIISNIFKVNLSLLIGFTPDNEWMNIPLIYQFLMET